MTTTEPNALALTTRSSREAEISNRLVDLCGQATRCIVNSDETAERATSLASAIKANQKALDEDRKSIVDPLNRVVKEINERYKRLAAPIEAALEYLQGNKPGAHGQLHAWNLKKQAERDEAARRERERLETQRLEDARLAEEHARLLRQEGDHEAAAIADQQAEVALEQAIVVPEKVVAKSAPTRGIVGGSSGLASVGKFRVVDLAALLRHALAQAEAGQPVTFVQVDEVALGRIARAPEADMKPTIPGVEFYREYSSRIRG